MTDTTLAPLTEEDFQTGEVYGGYHLGEDEWGSSVIAYGHLPKSKFAAAVNEYDGETSWTGTVEAVSSYSSVDVEHVWIVINERDSDGGWAGRIVDEETEGAVPATMVLR